MSETTTTDRKRIRELIMFKLNGTTDPEMARWLLKQLRYTEPGYHVLGIGFALAIDILVIGMATLLVLRAAGILG